MDTKIKKERRYRRHRRIRKKILGTKDNPRLCVFRSQRHIYCQLIDDEEGKIITFANDLELVKGKKKRQAVTKETAKEIGKLIARKAKKG